MTQSSWAVGLLATLALTALGLLYANATLLAATLIPLGYVLYGAVSSLPLVELRAERSIEPATATPGTAVEVTVTVENTGDRVLPDVRLADGVPEELEVTGGSPRLSASLSPGERRQLRYRVVARRGTAAFEKPVVRLRSLAGTERETRTLEAAGDGELVGAAALESAPFQRQTTPHVGHVTAESGGSGLEFHSTRQYRQGDPVTRIDWHHVARTGEFITVQYRERKASQTVLVVDARPVGRVAPGPGRPTGVDRASYAAEVLYEALTAAGVETSLAVVGLEDGAHLTPDPAGIVWAGANESVPAATAFDAVAQVGSREPPGASRAPTVASVTGGTEPGDENRRARADGGDEQTRLIGNVSPNARVILCSPLVDNWPVELARGFGRDRELIAVSPDPVGAATSPGERVAAVNRRLRLRELGRARVRTVDWSPDQPLEAALRDSLEVVP